MKKPDGSLISHFSRMAKKYGGINLAQGRPGFDPPEELLEILRENSSKGDLHQYAPANGDFRLLELLAKRYSKYSPKSTDNFLVVNGATEGIFLVFLYLTKITEKPFFSLSFDPVYESYPEVSRLFDIPFHYFDLDENMDVDFNRLEKVIRDKKVKIMFIASPGNPLGKVWTEREINQVISLSKKYDFYIIFDAVYNDIYFKIPPFNPMSLEYKKLFYVNSFSKMLSISGWRIGYTIADSIHMKKIRNIHDYTSVSSPSIFQTVIAEYLSRFDFGKEYIQSIREKCRGSYSSLKGVLDKTGFLVPEIQGGYFIWAKLPPRYPDAFEFATDLYNKSRVSLVPGENFSLTKKNYVRINIGNEISIIKEAAVKIQSFFR